MIRLFSTFSNNILQYWVAGQNMGASSGHHVLSLHSLVSTVFQQTRQFTNFSEPKQICWNIATVAAATFLIASRGGASPQKFEKRALTIFRLGPVPYESAHQLDCSLLFPTAMANRIVSTQKIIW